MALAIPQSDAGYEFDAILKSNGTPIDLTSASVVFKARKVSLNAIKINRACSIVGAPGDGRVRVPLTGADLAEPAVYEGTFHVTISGNTDLVPSNSTLRFFIFQPV